MIGRTRETLVAPPTTASMVATAGQTMRSTSSWLVLCTAALAAGCDHIDSLDPGWLLQARHQPHASQEGQWAGHHGATLHGVATADATPPVHFDSQRNVRWQVDLRGVGNSSPTIYGERVFVTAQRHGDPPSLVVLCINRTDGSIAWERSVGTPIGQTHHKNGYASSTVATDGERIYATFGALGVFCFSVDGEPLWRTPLDHWDHAWGQASSPVLSGDLVIQLADGANGSYLIAMNCYTGAVLWKTARRSSGCWTTPVLMPVVVNGQPRWEIVVNGTGSSNGSPGYVIAYAPDTGKELWRVRGTSDIPCPTAIVGESIVVSTSGKNGPIVAIRPGGSGDVTQSHVLWRLPWGGPSVPTGLIENQLLFLISDGGLLRCLNVEDGSELWHKRLHRSYSASLVAGDGKLYCTSERGDIHVFAAADRCELLAVNHLRQPCLATPAIAHGDLFVRTDQHLYCFTNQSETGRDNGTLAGDVQTGSTTDATVEPIPTSTVPAE